MSSPPTPATLLDDGLRALGLEDAVPAARRLRLLAYLDLLTGWNRHTNLTAVREPAAMVTRHLLDALALLPHVQRGRLADLGSGAGLPGIPLAIARPDLAVTLVDSNGKKARFLRAAVAELGLAATVAQARIETLQGPFETITARALSSLAQMLDWGGHLLAEGGIWLAQKGRYPDEELRALPPGYAAQTLPLPVPGLDAQRHLVIIRRRLTGNRSAA